jgi:hypothetical protein
MAVQSKTLVNDVGSAVVDELASQLNKSISSTGPFLLLSISGDNKSTFTTADGGQNLFMVFHAAEDCLLTSVKVLTSGGTGNSQLGADGDTLICLMKLASTWDNGDGTVSGGFDNINNTNHALGTGDGQDVVLATHSVSASSVWDTQSRWLELLGVTAAGAAIPADLYNDIMTDHAATPIKDSPSTLAMNAGDTLVMLFHNSANTTIQMLANVSLRPMKDQLNLSPSFTQKTFATKNR